jgi:hypothetical protein
LLAQFDRSGLSAAAFARQHRLTYTTFCGWRKQRARTQSSPGFVQVELPTPSSASELTIELGAQVRLRLTTPGHVELAALLIHKFNATASC